MNFCQIIKRSIVSRLDQKFVVHLCRKWRRKRKTWASLVGSRENLVTRADFHEDVSRCDTWFLAFQPIELRKRPAFNLLFFSTHKGISFNLLCYVDVLQEDQTKPTRPCHREIGFRKSRFEAIVFDCALRFRRAPSFACWKLKFYFFFKIHLTLRPADLCAPQKMQKFRV